MNNKDIRKNEKLTQLLWFTGGALCGLAMLSISKASIPTTARNANVPSNVTDDTAIYQTLSEIQVDKERAPNFDSDISRLSKIEARYRDNLPGKKREYIPAPKRGS